jgi:hypothetical protein
VVRIHPPQLKALDAWIAQQEPPFSSRPEAIRRTSCRTSAHPQTINFAEIRSSGVRGMLIYCADYRCSHYIAISGDRWPDDVCLSDLEPRFSDKRGADVRPDFNWDKPGSLSRGYRALSDFWVREAGL